MLYEKFFVFLVAIALLSLTACSFVIDLPSGATVAETPVEAGRYIVKVEKLNASTPSIQIDSTPLPAATAVPAEQPQPATPVANVNCNFSIPRGEYKLVQSGCIVSGDIEVATSQNGPWKVLYDSEQETGLVVNITASTYVKAPYGASVTNASTSDVVNALKQTGCGLPTGCTTVTVKNWPQ